MDTRRKAVIFVERVDRVVFNWVVLEMEEIDGDGMCVTLILCLTYAILFEGGGFYAHFDL